MGNPCAEHELQIVIVFLGSIEAKRNAKTTSDQHTAEATQSPNWVTHTRNVVQVLKDMFASPLVFTPQELAVDVVVTSTHIEALSLNTSSGCQVKGRFGWLQTVPKERANRDLAWTVPGPGDDNL